MKSLTHVHRSALAVLLLSALVDPVPAQIGSIESPQTETLPPRQQLQDPLGRTTPVGTIAGFIRAVDRADFVSAARYMQVSASQRANVDTLARDLKGLMDRYLSQALTNISDSPNGVMDDGLPLDRENVGPLTIGERKIYISLVRVTDPQAGPIWLISSETLAQIPALHAAVTQSWIERAMPAWLVNHELFGISLAHWVVLAA
jgi:MscS family membrane protein